jgi:DNA-binding MarR family transcriptional regulator
MNISNKQVKQLADYIEQLTYRMKTMEQTSMHNLSSEVSMPEIQVLVFLGQSGAGRMSDIAAHMFSSLSNMTVIVDKLVKKGLVERSRSQEDRRVVMIALTEKGEEYYLQHHEVKLELSRRMLGALDENERNMYLAFIDKIIRNIK